MVKAISDHANSKLFWQTVSCFDKQQAILTKRNYESLLHTNFCARYFVTLKRTFASRMVHDTNVHQISVALQLSYCKDNSQRPYLRPHQTFTMELKAVDYCVKKHLPLMFDML